MRRQRRRMRAFYRTRESRVHPVRPRRIGETDAAPDEARRYGYGLGARRSGVAEFRAGPATGELRDRQFSSNPRADKNSAKGEQTRTSPRQALKFGSIFPRDR